MNNVTLHSKDFLVNNTRINVVTCVHNEKFSSRPSPILLPCTLLQYAAELARLNKELAEIKNEYEVSRREDMQRVVEQNFQSDSHLNEVELQEYK